MHRQIHAWHECPSRARHFQVFVNGDFRVSIKSKALPIVHKFKGTFKCPSRQDPIHREDLCVHNKDDLQFRVSSVKMRVASNPFQRAATKGIGVKALKQASVTREHPPYADAVYVQ
eukprot:1154153-Pelagomonas_calceolata.AAC.1